MILNAFVERLKRRSKDDFKGRHFEASLILQAVSWWACRKVCEQAEKRADWFGLQAGLPSYGRCEMRLRLAHPTAIFKLCARPQCGARRAPRHARIAGVEPSGLLRIMRFGTEARFPSCLWQCLGSVRLG